MCGTGNLRTCRDRLLLRLVEFQLAKVAASVVGLLDKPVRSHADCQTAKRSVDRHGCLLFANGMDVGLARTASKWPLIRMAFLATGMADRLLFGKLDSRAPVSLRPSMDRI